MALFKEKEQTIMVCVDCKIAYYTDGTATKCGNCGATLYYLTNKVVTKTEWLSWNKEEQTNYINAVVNAVAKSREKKKEELSDFEKFITTTNTFENYEIEEYIGTVSGVDYYLAGGFVGEGMLRQSELFEGSFKKAKKKMFDNVRTVNGNAVVGMTTQLTCVANGNMVVSVTGTAVKIKKDDE